MTFNHSKFKHVFRLTSQENVKQNIHENMQENIYHEHSSNFSVDSEFSRLQFENSSKLKWQKC